jgi:type IV secretory pathway TraG/TraD family ATPase VirD4
MLSKEQIASLKIPLGVIAILLFILGIAVGVSGIMIVSSIGLGLAWIGIYIIYKEDPTRPKQPANGFILYLNDTPFLKRLIGTLSVIFFFCMFSAKTGGVIVLLLLLSVTLGALWIAAMMEGKKEKPTDDFVLTHHGSAAWSTREQINEVFNNETEGLYLGAGFRRKKGGHQICAAGSGAGKGTCLIIPTLLSKPHGSYIVTDPKGENAFITARYQKSAGQRVFILDPWGEQAKFGAVHGIPSSGFNPFVFLKQDLDELRDNCEQIATFLVPDRPDSKDPYWNDRARSMIKILLMHIITFLPETEHNFWTLYKMVRLAGDEWFKLLADLKQNEAEDGLISIAAQELIGIEKAGTTMAGIRSTAQNATTMFESPQLRKSLETDDFNPYFLTQGDCTVYVVIPERHLDSHSLWLRLVVGLSLKACNAKPNKRVNFLLDEFAVLGKMKDIQRGFAFARGQNIVIWIFVQSLSQLKEIYGEDGMNSFIGNAAVLQAFGLNDYFTMEYISKLLGDGTYEKSSFTVSGSGENRTSSKNYSTYGRPLMTPDEVKTEENIITIVEDKKMIIIKTPYFMDLLSDIPDEKYGDYVNHMNSKGFKVEGGREFLKRADPRPNPGY